jgi:hypothetical protein
MKPKKYKLLQFSSTGNRPANTVVYEAMVYDYNLAADDTAYTGKLHISVTLNENGDYPTFTVPLHNLEEINDEPN